jgi:hypothetical protein
MEHWMQQPFGYDYGTRPKVMVVGDGEFPSLLRRSLTALGYGMVPHFGVLVDAPLLAMMFDDEHVGRECFAHFKRWAGGSRDGDAVGISFIEFANGEYGMCVFQERERLINRYLSEREQAEVDPLWMVTGHLKVFEQQSDSYWWFKQAVKTSPCVVAPATGEGDVLLDCAFWKREMYFYREHEVPEQSVETVLLRSRNADGATERRQPIPPELRPKAPDLNRRRQAQLVRFFPVTLELLHFSPQFRQVRQALVDEGYQEWQVMQAACNIALQSRLPLMENTNGRGSHEEDGSLKMQILDFLLDHAEDLSVTLPPIVSFSKTQLLGQIRADSYDLLHYIASPDAPEVTDNEIQQELAKRGFVEAG